MADFAFYWSQYRQESGTHGLPIIGWYTSRAWIADRITPGDRLWLFIGGNACGHTESAHCAYLAEVFVVESVKDNPEYEPDVPGSSQFIIIGVEDNCKLVEPPLLVDSILRRPGTDSTLPIGVARQTPFQLDEAQVAELLALLPTGSQEEGIRIPEEVPSASSYTEGSVQRILVNRYERDPRAKEACIRHYGTECFICGFDFVAVYGEVMTGFIHVHHLRPLSEVGEEYEVDPVADLRPVCPNCHAVLHRRVPAYSIEEVRAFLRQRVLP